jgi:3'-phosphoadenosine 5'-phosphosulfate sulfotransferase (PAPS reductase)/FAD synthetase
MKLPWMCPACGTVHTHPSVGCRHCGREIPDGEPDPIFRTGESEDTKRSDHRVDQETSPKPKLQARTGKGC